MVLSRAFYTDLPPSLPLEAMMNDTDSSYYLLFCIITQKIKYWHSLGENLVNCLLQL